MRNRTKRYAAITATAVAAGLMAKVLAGAHVVAITIPIISTLTKAVGGG